MTRKMQFCFSIDVELGAGLERSRSGQPRDPRQGRKALLRLLDLLADAGIPATFAFVGHLLLRQCEGHPFLRTPSPKWFENDPCSSFPENDLWYAPDLVERVLQADVDHELACHSFSHISMADPRCTVEVARSELEACLEAAEPYGASMHTFVFPYNEVGHVGLITEYGFDHVTAGSWSSQEPGDKHSGPWISGGLTWVPRTFYLSDSSPRTVARLARLVSIAAREKAFIHVWTHEWALSPGNPLRVLRALFGFMRRKADSMVVGDVELSEAYDRLNGGQDSQY